MKMSAIAIQSYSKHSLITQNCLHDVNNEQQDDFLSALFWGSTGIHLGIGNQETAYNIIENMFVEGVNGEATAVRLKLMMVAIIRTTSTFTTILPIWAS